MNRREILVSRLSRLVSIPTVNPPGESYEDAAGLIAEWLRDAGMKVDLIRIPEDWLEKNYPYSPQHKGHPRILVYAHTGRRDRVLHFNGHYDVVPPGTGWSVTEPFKPLVKDGRMYGRGTTDMKGGIVSAVTALEEILSEDIVDTSDLGLEAAFVPDEESGGDGTKYLVEEAGVRPSYVVIAEPSTLRRIAIGHKGFVRGLIHVYGRQVHGSVPFMGENAFEKACMLLGSFKPAYEENVIKPRVSKYPIIPEEAKHPTLNLGGQAESTSHKDNIVPGEFVFSFDRRVLPEENVEEAARELKEYLEKAAERTGARVKVEILSMVPGSVTPPDSELVLKASEAMSSVTGRQPQILVSTGRTDQVYYSAHGSSVVVMGPGAEGTAHMPDEYTLIEELNGFVDVYKYLARLLASSRSEGRGI